MEDNTKQLLTADASLYNGQPIDTGSSCPSARLTSCTPSISKNKGGVSVENVPNENQQWFVLRVSYGRIIKAKAFVEAKGFECYVPMRYKEVKKQGKKRISTEPLLPSFLFVTSNNIQFKLCDKVVVTKGEFKGIHGRVARFAGQQRVVVELFDGCFVATAYVPKEAMTKSETLLNKSKI